MKRFSEKENTKWFASMPKKSVAVKLIIKSDKNHVLVVKPDYKDAWQFPGGGVEAHESPDDAAIRELKEELNLNLQQGAN